MGCVYCIQGVVCLLLFRCHLTQAFLFSVNHTSSGHVIINDSFHLCNDNDWFGVPEAEVVCSSYSSVWRLIVYVDESDIPVASQRYQYKFQCRGYEEHLSYCPRTILPSTSTKCQAFRLVCHASARLSEHRKGWLIVRQTRESAVPVNGSEFLVSVEMINVQALVPSETCDALGFDGLRTLQVDARSFKVDEDQLLMRVKKIVCRHIENIFTRRTVCAVIYPLDKLRLPLHTHYTYYSRQIALECVYGMGQALPHRLAGEPSTIYGRLEFQYGNTSAWYPVCRDGFTEADGRVACRALGFPESDRRTVRTDLSPTIPVNPYPFILRSPGCDGNETSLDKCIGFSQIWFPAQCGTGDIGIRCDHSGMPMYELIRGNRIRGLLSAQYVGARWYVGWEDFGLAEARVTCRSMGLQHTRPLISRRDSHAEFNAPIQPVTILCKGLENRIDDCTVTWGHGQRIETYIVYLECLDTEFVEHSLRLDDRLSSSAGRVQLLIYGQWADVCLRHITSDVATIVCRQLGSQEGVQFSQAHVLYLGLFQQTSRRHTVALNLITCPPNAERFDQCTWSKTFEYCSGMRLAISCVPPDLVSMDFRLAGDRLQVRQYGLWGDVCAPTRGVDNINMQICLDASIEHTDAPIVNKLAWMRIDSCSGLDGELTQACIHTALVSTYCVMGTQAISIRCDISGYINNAPMRLVGGETEYEGRVEIQLRGIWGGICTVDQPSEALARTTCANLQIGSSGAEIQSSIGFGSGDSARRIHLSGVECRFFTLSFSRCELKLSTHNTCPARNTLAVSCLSQAASRPKTNVAVIIGSVCGVAFLLAVIILITCIACRRCLPGGMTLQTRMTSHGRETVQGYSDTSARASVRHENRRPNGDADAPPDYFISVHYQNRGGDVIDMNVGRRDSRSAGETRGSEALPPKYEDLFPTETQESCHSDRSRDTSVVTSDSLRQPSAGPIFV